MRRLRPILLAALVAVVISGCSATASVEPDASAPSQTPTPTPSPTIEPVDTVDPSTWIISADGIGPVTLGQSLDEAATALARSSYTKQDLACDNPGVLLYAATGAPTVVIFVAAGSPTVAGVRIADYDSVLPSGASPRTEEGLGLGATVADVQAQYPDAVGEVATGSPNYTHVVGDDVWISFATLYPDETRVLNIDVAKGGHMFYELCGF